jgi:hypothetical protein
VIHKPTGFPTDMLMLFNGWAFTTKQTNFAKLARVQQLGLFASLVAMTKEVASPAMKRRTKVITTGLTYKTAQTLHCLARGMPK